MPFGILNDLAKGGIIQTGKNFIPRLKNIVSGDTLINRPEVKLKEKITTNIKDNNVKGGDTK